MGPQPGANGHAVNYGHMCTCSLWKSQRGTPFLFSFFFAFDMTLDFISVSHFTVGFA